MEAEIATKQCAFCGEKVLAVAIKCKHCQSDLTASPERQKVQRRTWSIFAVIVCASVIAILSLIVAVFFMVATNGGNTATDAQLEDLAVYGISFLASAIVVAGVRKGHPWAASLGSLVGGGSIGAFGCDGYRTEWNWLSVSGTIAGLGLLVCSRFAADTLKHIIALSRVEQPQRENP